jgi:hypothetical protein
VSFRTTCPECGADQAAGRCSHDPSFVADVPVDEIAAEALDLYDDYGNGIPPVTPIRSPVM